MVTYGKQTKEQQDKANKQYETIKAEFEKLTTEQRIDVVLSLPEFFPECIDASREQLQDYVS